MRNATLTVAGKKYVSSPISDLVGKTLTISGTHEDGRGGWIVATDDQGIDWRIEVGLPDAFDTWRSATPL